MFSWLRGGLTSRPRPLSRTLPRARRRPADERGAVLVEAAFVISFILVPLTFGAVETSFFVSHANVLSDAARAAARAGVQTIDAPADDYYILQSLASDADLASRGDILKVIVFKADNADGSPPINCETASVAGVCNFYTGADLALSKAEIDALQTAWPPSDRGADAAGNMPFLGVKIVSAHNGVTGSWPILDELSATQVMRVEPTSARSLIFVTPNSGYTPYVYTAP